MKLTINCAVLQNALQRILGIVERRQTLPILANVYISAAAGKLVLTTTDLEMEQHLVLAQGIEKEGETTLPARKLQDICRSLPEATNIDLESDNDRATLRAGRSRFSINALPANDFPMTPKLSVLHTLLVRQQTLLSLLQQTHFCMAQNDVRYYLNGLLLDVDAKNVRAIATDGHRLAMSQAAHNQTVDDARQVIIPRKSVLELLRHLKPVDEDVELQFSANHLRVRLEDLRFTTKLIDGRFPDYNSVIPKPSEQKITLAQETMKQALARAGIFSTERFHAVSLGLQANLLRIEAYNAAKEKSEEEVDVIYSGDSFEIGMNVNYLLEAVSAINSAEVELSLTDANSSCLLQGTKNDSAKYVIMPMRL